MADKYAVATANWSSTDAWSLSSGGLPGAAKPQAGESVIFDANSGNITVSLDENTASLGGLNMTGFTGTLDLLGYNCDSSGDTTIDGTFTGTGNLLCGGSLEILSGASFDIGVTTILNASTGSHILTSNSNTLGGLIIDDSGGDAVFTFADEITCAAFTHTDGITTLSEDLSCSGFAIDGGTFDDDGNNIYAAGPITRTGGVFTSSGSLTVTDNTTISGASTSFNINHLIIAADKILTPLSSFYAKKVTPTGSVAETSYTILITGASAGWWGLQVGTVASNLRLRFPSAGTVVPGNDIRLENKGFEISVSGSKTFAWDGNIDLGGGELYIRDITAGSPNYAEVNMGAYSLTNASVKLGDSGATNQGSGKIGFGTGSHSILSLAKGSAGNGANEINFGSSVVACSGILNGDNITCTADTAIVIGGTLSNVDLDSGLLLYAGSTDDGSNTGDILPFSGSLNLSPSLGMN